MPKLLALLTVICSMIIVPSVSASPRPDYMSCDPGCGGEPVCTDGTQGMTFTGYSGQTYLCERDPFSGQFNWVPI